MILYGEDRITPSEESSDGALQNWTRYPKEYHPDILVLGMIFIAIKDLPYLKCTVSYQYRSWIALAMDLLRRKRKY
jgi:hypothetical protein